MRHGLRAQFRLPVRDAQEKLYITRVLWTVLVLSLVAAALMLVNALLVGHAWVAAILGGFMSIGVLLITRLRRGDLVSPSLALPSVMLVCVTAALVVGFGIHDIALLVYPLVIISAGLLLGRRAALLFSLLCVLSAVGVVVAEVLGRLESEYSARTSIYDALTLATLLSATGALLWFIMTNLRNSLERTREKERALAESNRQLLAQERKLEALVADLEARNVEMGHFNYAVSHDLKAPLVTIAGFADLAARELTEGRQQAAKRDLEQIRKAVLTMKSSLDGLLRISTCEVSEAERRSVDFAAVVEEALDLVGVASRRPEVEVVVHDDLPRVVGQRTLLVQLTQNLIDNAVKFLGDQRRPRIEIGSERRNGELLLFVRDNGIGIDPRLQERVFEPFSRLQTSVEGSGIGLALVRRIVESHGGRIWAESAGAGAGATFLFALPSGDRASLPDAPASGDDGR